MPDSFKDSSSASQLDDSLGFLIEDAGRAIKRALYLRITQHNLRVGHWYCLRALFQQDGITQRELSQRLGIKESSTVEMLHAMEAEELVYRERDAADRRKVRVYLTTRAHALRPTLMAILAEVRQLMVSRMSPDEEALVKSHLRQLRQVLDEDTNQRVAALPGKQASMFDAESRGTSWLASGATAGKAAKKSGRPGSGH